MRMDLGRSAPDELAESSDESSDARAPALDTGWGDGDLAARSGRSSRPLAVKPLRVHAPPAAGELLERDGDAVESLFRADRTLRAPTISISPSEAELTRRHAAARISLFDEGMTDPAPAPPLPAVAPRAEPAAPRAEPPVLP